MTWINHLGLWLMAMFVLNVAECFHKTPFCRKEYQGWWIPSATATIGFVGMEIFLGILYLIIM